MSRVRQRQRCSYSAVPPGTFWYREVPHHEDQLVRKEDSHVVLHTDEHSIYSAGGPTKGITIVVNGRRRLAPVQAERRGRCFGARFRARDERPELVVHGDLQNGPASIPGNPPGWQHVRSRNGMSVNATQLISRNPDLKRLRRADVYD